MADLLAAPAFRLFAIVYLLLVVKMMIVGSYTSIVRIRRGAFATPEDYAFQRATPHAGRDEDVERVRRAHRNDLENILPFFAIGFFYALSHPPLWAAQIYYIGFLVARVLHSVFYIRGLQPHRTAAFGLGAVLMTIMLVNTLIVVARAG